MHSPGWNLLTDGELIGVVGKQGVYIQGVKVVGHLLAHIGKSFSHRGGSKRVSGHAEAGLVGPVDQWGIGPQQVLVRTNSRQSLDVLKFLGRKPSLITLPQQEHPGKAVLQFTRHPSQALSAKGLNHDRSV